MTEVMLGVREQQMQDNAVATGGGTEIVVTGYSTLSLQVTGTFVGTITWEARITAGDWAAIQVQNEATGAAATTATAPGLYTYPCTGKNAVRARISSWTSGAISVLGQASIQSAGAGYADVDITDSIDRLLGKITNYDVLVDGTLAAAEETVEIPAAGLSTVGLGISGTWVGTIVAEMTVGDGAWDVVPLVDQTLAGAALSTSANGTWLLGIAGALTLRIRMSAWTSGTATVYLEGSSAPAGVFLSRSIPTGLNSIGTVGLNAGSNAIGDVGHKSYTTIACGELAGSATAVQMPNVACKLVNFKAAVGNAGNIYIGGAGVTKPNGSTDVTTGFELDAGQETGWLPTDNLARFYRICDNTGDDLTYLALS